jgi:hypothetical protein
MNEDWFATRDGKSKYGPYSWAKLKELADFGRLEPTDMVLPPGQDQWVRMDTVEGLVRQQSSITDLPVAQLFTVAPAPPPVQVFRSNGAREDLRSCFFNLLLLIGLGLSIGGGFGLYHFWTMDATVETKTFEMMGSQFGGNRVYNLGLMQTQHDGIITSLAALCVGLILTLGVITIGLSGDRRY